MSNKTLVKHAGRRPTLCFAGFLWLLFAALTPVAPVMAQASNGAPAYQLLVCLRMSKHPALTPLFAETLRRQVHDQLSNLFGPLANVDVRTAGHWWLDDFEGHDFQSPPITAQLLAERPVRGKLFLVGVDFQQGLYHIHWRQVDGDRRQVDAAHTRTSPDRQWVAKAICLTVRDEFAIVADVKRGGPFNLQIEFQGHLPRELTAKFLAEETVFQPYWLQRKRTGEIERRPVPFTLLWVNRNKLGEPQLVSGLAEPFPARASIVGMEAVKIGTRRGRLQLRLIDPVSGAPVINCSVAANDTSFDTLSDADLLERPNREGVVTTRREFQHKALVKISTGGSNVLKFPVPITHELTYFEIKVPTDRRANEKNELERLLRSVQQDLQQITLVHSETVRDFNEQNKNKRYEDALQRVAETVTALRPNLQNLNQQLAQAKRLAKDLGQASNLLLDSVSTQVAAAEARNLELADLKASLETAISTRDAQERANVLIKLGQQAEQEGNIDDALARYELALGEQPNQPALRNKLDRMKTLWNQKSPARELIIGRWANAEITDFEALLGDVEKAVDTLNAAGDYLTMKKLLAINNAHANTISEFVEQLNARNDEADQKDKDKFAALVQRIAALSEKTAKLIEPLLPVENADNATAKPNAAPAKAPPVNAASGEEEPLK